jgi:hypothetical protein
MAELNDLTIIMMTPNKVPKTWAEYHKKILMDEAGDAQFITISNEPLDWGTNLIQTEYSVTNIYRQMLRGAKIATTPFIAIADDDTLYPREHFLYRPPMDRFGYNYNRWHILTWKRKVPYYFYKPRPGNGLLICSRELMITAIENRLKDRNELVGYLARELGTGKYVKDFDKAEFMEFYTYHPVVSFYHDYSVDPHNQHHTKRPWPVQCFDLPKWGHVKGVLEKFV